MNAVAMPPVDGPPPDEAFDNALIKHDYDRGAAEVHRFGRDASVGEAVFVRRGGRRRRRLRPGLCPRPGPRRGGPGDPVRPGLHRRARRTGPPAGAGAARLPRELAPRPLTATRPTGAVIGRSRPGRRRGTGSRPVAGGTGPTGRRGGGGRKAQESALGGAGTKAPVGAGKKATVGMSTKGAGRWELPAPGSRPRTPATRSRFGPEAWGVRNRRLRRVATAGWTAARNSTV